MAVTRRRPSLAVHPGRTLQLALENRRYRRAIPIALRHLANISDASADWSESARLLDEGITRLESLIRLDPRSDELQFLLGSMLCSRSTVALAEDDMAICAARVAAASDLVKHALAMPEPGARWHYLHIRVLEGRKRVALRHGQPNIAAECAASICEIYRQLATTADADPKALRGYADCLRSRVPGDSKDVELSLEFACRADELAEGRDPYTLKLIAELELALGNSAAVFGAVNRARALVGPRTTLRGDLDELAKRAETLNANADHAGERVDPA